MNKRRVLDRIGYSILRMVQAGLAYMPCGAEVEFRVLGPVEVWSAGGRVDAGHAKQQSVLAVLVLELGRVVPVDVLIDRVWGDNPPASVWNSLYACVAKLRSAFTSAGDERVALARRSGGYLLEADADQVDLYRFRRWVSEASEADDGRAAQLLGEAMRLWRGSALAGAGSPGAGGGAGRPQAARAGAVAVLGETTRRAGGGAARGRRAAWGGGVPSV